MVPDLDRDFAAVTDADIPLISEYLKLANYEESNHNIVNMMLWRDTYPLWKCQTDNWLILLGIHEKEFFVYMPLCRPQYLIPAVKCAKAIFDYYQMPFVLSSYIEPVIKQIAPAFLDYAPKEFRDPADYVYLTEKFQTYGGKKLQKKRNHLNAFYAEYGDRFVYEPINDANQAECLEFLSTWKTTDEDEFLQAELLGIRNLFTIYDKLPIKGGLIRIDGQVKAFTLGSQLTKRMCQINVEKADESIRGLYQAIAQEFLLHEFQDTLYVNREDDMGKLNIRQSKLSYYPAYLITKYRLCNGSGHDC